MTDIVDAVYMFRMALKSAGLSADNMTVVISEKDGRRLEHMMIGLDRFVISEKADPRMSKPHADNMIREFTICGVKFQYRTKPFILPSGKVV